MDIEITEEKWNNPAERARLVTAFLKRILDNACAALNARTNMILYFGVKDDGTILGIRIKDYSLVTTGQSSSWLLLTFSKSDCQAE